MSIFFSPDTPKRIDPTTGRMTRLVRNSPSFLNEQHTDLRRRHETAMKTSHVTTECTDLRSIRGAYSTFVDLFSVFNTENGPEITGVQISEHLVHLKQAFEPFLVHASHYFNSSAMSHRVRRYSPLLGLSAKVLAEWALIVSRMNELSASPSLPHLELMQKHFDMVVTEIPAVSSGKIVRKYYRDDFFVRTSDVQRQMWATFERISEVMSIAETEGFHKSQLKDLKGQLLNFSRRIEEDFFELLPSAVTTTPEMSRLRQNVKSACGNVMSLLDAAYYYRRRMRKLIKQMSVMQTALCAVLDRMGISYEIDVSPSLETDDKGEEEEELSGRDGETTEERVESFVHGVSDLLHLDLSKVRNPCDQLGVVERELRRVFGVSQLARVDIPPPIRSQPPSRFTKRPYREPVISSARVEPAVDRERPPVPKQSARQRKPPRPAKTARNTPARPVERSDVPSPFPTSPVVIWSLVQDSPRHPEDNTPDLSGGGRTSSTALPSGAFSSQQFPTADGELPRDALVPDISPEEPALDLDQPAVDDGALVQGLDALSSENEPE
jgi:hypothetical protein